MLTSLSPWAMPLISRRVFRLSGAMALALALAYGLSFPLPFIAPIFAMVLGSSGAPPPGAKGLVGLLVLVLATLCFGILLTPMLVHYAQATVLIIALGVFFSNYLTVGKGKALVGMFLMVGITLISAAGLVDHFLAVLVIQGLVFGIGLAVISLWIVYPFFPEDLPQSPDSQKAEVAAEEGVPPPHWIALRATCIVMPAFLLTLTNPTMYLAVIMKTVNLGQQGSLVNARDAGRELLGSTFMAGLLAIVFWFALGLLPNLWMFTLWTLLFSIYIVAKMYGVIRSRFSASFWLNAGMTMFILLGPAVEDSANGKDVYTAFFVRMGLFIGVTLYAWLAIILLEWWRARHINQNTIKKGVAYD